MAHNANTPPAKALERLLELSKEQKRLIEEGRIEELLKRHEEREALFSVIRSFGTDVLIDAGSKKAIEEILENDKELAVYIESAMASIAKSLSKISSGKKAVKAYTNG